MAGMGRVRRTLRYLVAGCLGLVLVATSVMAQPRGNPHSRTDSQSHRPPWLVVIDPGHGGIDPGAISADGVYEKNITLAVALDLARLLKASGSFRVRLTRGRDRYVPLHERVSRARAAHADLFLSIHADALPNPAMRGLSVFTLSQQASDRIAATLAASENRDPGSGSSLPRHPPAVQAVLIDLALRQTDNQSREFAHQIVLSLGREVQLLDNPQRSAGFVVLTAPDIPSALVELGCLSNPIEAQLLRRRIHQRRLAQGLAAAIEAYFARRRIPAEERCCIAAGRLSHHTHEATVSAKSSVPLARRQLSRLIQSIN
jgi:N-acetylmuramoyl-L-alanine amidase